MMQPSPRGSVPPTRTRQLSSVYRMICPLPKGLSFYRILWVFSQDQAFILPALTECDKLNERKKDCSIVRMKQEAEA